VPPNAATFQAQLRAVATAARAAGDPRPGLALRRAAAEGRAAGCPPSLGAYRVALKAAAARAPWPPKPWPLERQRRLWEELDEHFEEEAEAEETSPVRRQRMLGPPATDPLGGGGETSAAAAAQAVARGRLADCEALWWMASSDGVLLDAACANALLGALANAGAAAKAVALLRRLMVAGAGAAGTAAAGTAAVGAAAAGEAGEPWSGAQLVAGACADGASFSFALAACVEGGSSAAEVVAAAAPAVALLRTALLPPLLPFSPPLLPGLAKVARAAGAERLEEAARGYLTARGLRALTAFHMAQAEME
jgi:hypothetical protein